MTPKPQHLVVAINPTARFGASAEVGPAVVSTLRGLGHRVTSLTEPDFAQLLDSAGRAVARKPDALVVVGGDGMVNLGVNVVAGTRIPLGIIPSGTGNDMARGLGIPVDNLEAAIDHLAAALEETPREIDAVLVTTADGVPRWFAGVLSAGFDSLVNERANAMRWPKGPSRYTIALLRELVALRPLEYVLTLDGEVTRSRGVLLSAGNNVSFGGGMRITPDALLDDGLVDVLLAAPMSRFSLLRIFPRVFNGTHITDPRVTVRRARTVRIEADGVIAYADGERFGPLPADLVVRPRAVRVLVAP